MILELTLDAPQAEAIDAARRTDAQTELKHRLAGDHRSNNSYRPAENLEQEQA